ncbi:deoxyribodipyrimidine photo-lyase [Oxalobacteraceae bacterium GrIS 1.18]
MSVRLVWFKRDLRTQDHAALARAAQLGPVLCLYIIEPSVWQSPDSSQRQFIFLRQCLRDLYRQLQSLGARLHVVTGEVVEVLERLHHALPLAEIYSHQETGNALTYARDLAVAGWCRAHQIAWHECRQHGVIRALSGRNQWNRQWAALMDSQQETLVSLKTVDLPWAAESWPAWESWQRAEDQPPQMQTGGRSAGLAVLQSFLDQRSSSYRGGISSPLSAPTACSRLSPYLSWGCLGMREVVQATAQKLEQLPSESRAAKGLVGFLSRLHWHCHFIQKLESEPEIEWCNMHRGYDGLREGEWNQEHFLALTQNRTGWPLVDACVVMLRETGWLNFRMRAMLVSVAAYPLWLHWKPVGDWLATQFVDYEPGIHWSQMQMQSGTTGINTTRVYNPIKQARDHDPDGRFVRQWLPILRKVPDSWLFEPWKMPAEVQRHCGVMVGERRGLGEGESIWPMPPVDLDQATRVAKSRLHARRAEPDVRAAKNDIVERHGSRAGPRSRTVSRKAAQTVAQTSFEF